MSDDNLKNGHNPEVSFEPEDLEARPIITALIGLGLACIAIYFVVLWMYTFLDRYQATHQSGESPLVVVQQDTRHVTTEEIENFPQPRLETDERGQLDGVRTKEEDTLNSYGWVDESAGVVHIPIRQAMQMLVAQGLPMRPSAAKAPVQKKTLPAKKAAAKSEAKAVLAGKQ
jgi:hypothetical protein